MLYHLPSPRKIYLPNFSSFPHNLGYSDDGFDGYRLLGVILLGTSAVFQEESSSPREELAAFQNDASGSAPQKTKTERGINCVYSNEALR